MLGSRAEAEEIAQETFLRAHRALGEFRGEARLGDVALRHRLAAVPEPAGRRRSPASARTTRRAGPAADERRRRRHDARAERARGGPARGDRRAAGGPADRRRASRPRGPHVRGDRRGPRPRAGNGALAACTARGWSSRPSWSDSCHDLPGRARALLGSRRRRADAPTEQAQLRRAPGDVCGVSARVGALRADGRHSCERSSRRTGAGRLRRSRGGRTPAPVVRAPGARALRAVAGEAAARGRRGGAGGRPGHHDRPALARASAGAAPAEVAPGP